MGSLKGRDKTERYTLSSIRAPRLGTRGGYAPQSKTEKGRGGYSAKYATPDEYLSREAKEMVRQKCIGKEVRLIYEYSRENQFARDNKSKEKKFASIYVTNPKTKKEENLALELIKKGYAELVWHSKNESNRSEDYALLEEAFIQARKKKIGLNQFIKFDKDKNVNVADTKRRADKAKETAIKDYSGIQE